MSDDQPDPRRDDDTVDLGDMTLVETLRLARQAKRIGTEAKATVDAYLEAQRQQVTPPRLTVSVREVQQSLDLAELQRVQAWAKQLLDTRMAELPQQWAAFGQATLTMRAWAGSDPNRPGPAGEGRISMRGSAGGPIVAVTGDIHLTATASAEVEVIESEAATPDEVEDALSRSGMQSVMDTLQGVTPLQFVAILGSVLGLLRAVVGTTTPEEDRQLVGWALAIAFTLIMASGNSNR